MRALVGLSKEVRVKMFTSPVVAIVNDIILTRTRALFCMCGMIGLLYTIVEEGGIIYVYESSWYHHIVR